jgi:DNA-binding NtrC family response regulator
MKTILIVDDEDQIRSIYRKVIYSVGRSIFKIVESSSTEDVVGALMKENVDLVLLDIRIPNVDSRLLYQIIKT